MIRPHICAQLVIAFALYSSGCSSADYGNNEPGTPSVERLPAPPEETVPPSPVAAEASPAVDQTPVPTASPSPALTPASTPTPEPTLSSRAQTGWTGVNTPYTQYTTTFVNQWPQQAHTYLQTAGAAPVGKPLKLRCLSNPDAKYYVGLEQVMIVNAPLETLAATIDDFPGYQELFPDLDKAEVRGTYRDQILTFWEQHVPVFFIPNIKYEMIYTVSSKPAAMPSTRTYRFQLREEGQIRASDGLIALQRLTPQTTLYVEYDFTDADWGAVETFASGRIWKDTVKGIAITDIALKIKSEQPNLDRKAAREEAKDYAEKEDKAIEYCIEHRENFVPTSVSN